MGSTKTFIFIIAFIITFIIALLKPPDHHTSSTKFHNCMRYCGLKASPGLCLNIRRPDDEKIRKLDPSEKLTLLQSSSNQFLWSLANPSLAFFQLCMTSTLLGDDCFKWPWLCTYSQLSSAFLFVGLLMSASIFECHLKELTIIPVS